MNCKPGDLAVIVVDKDFPQNLGTFVAVVEPVENLENGLPAWGVRPMTPVMCWEHPGASSGRASMTQPGEEVDWADCELKPIRGPKLADRNEVQKDISVPSLPEVA